MVSKDEGLEAKIKKLFVKDKKTGMIRFIDEDYFLSQELGYSLQSKSAEEILNDLRKEFGRDIEIKKLFQQYLAQTNVFKSAYNQRDICKTLKPGTEGYYSDNFLREWDLNYKEFVPPENPYLTYEERHNASKVFESNIYDTREILPLIEKNIDGFRILDKRIGSHDVHVEYCGVKFQVMAGSHHPYEVPYANIIKLLKRIVKEDIKKKNIGEDDQSKRLEVLKNHIFE